LGIYQGLYTACFDRSQPAGSLYPYTAGRSVQARATLQTACCVAWAVLIPPRAGTLAQGAVIWQRFQIIGGLSVGLSTSRPVYHQHRRDYAGLRRQCGYVRVDRYLMKTLLDKPGVFSICDQTWVYLCIGSAFPRIAREADYPLI
jgi:hypothetical protein